MNAKIKISFLLILLSVSTFIYSQQKNIDKTFEIEIKNKSSKFTKEANFHKAQLFFLAEKWNSTLVYSMKQLSVNSNDVELNDYCHFFRGFSFKQKKLFKESQKELNKISSDFEFYNRVKMILGEIALEQNEFQKAINYFEELEDIADTNFFGLKTSKVNHNLGICYLHLNDFKKAESYLIKSTKLQEIEKDTLMLVGAYGDIATLYYDQYKDNEAIPYFEKAYHLSKKTNDFQLKKTAAMNMAVVEENRKNFPLALTYRKEFEKWKDSLNDQNKVWAVAELEKQFAVKQKQKEVTVLQAENKLKVAERNGLFYSSVSLLLLFGAGTYFYRQKVKNNKIILAQKSELDELNATKDKLFSIVSHDLRSSVSALKTSNTKLQHSLETKNFTELDIQLNNNSAITNGAYNLLDNLLHWALLQTKQSYFNRESQRLFFIVEQTAYNYTPLMLDKNIKFENKVSKSALVFVDQESLKMILRNFLDNAIKFSNQEGEITVYSRDSNEDYWDLVIEDSGLGMNDVTCQELMKETVLLSKKINEDIVGTGLGLQLCKSMIKKNGGKFRIESEEGKGTKMIVSLPKTQKDG
ncbi:ATP-binding protein [Flavobacterium sp. K5-23]|uniref:tetratricopeptide repeat-containing sensor histidine kinase n=1 Tax=Flavobacterium sp. K5-23 TaxID=2746225 RepID=UPI00200C8597|nr:ATP-binding protein [Flavobacterium sp. K5-23]UQD56214.1 tetratricopeptide repeat protein [Flavobacterium sp. K5-23]